VDVRHRILTARSSVAAGAVLLASFVAIAGCSGSGGTANAVAPAPRYRCPNDDSDCGGICVSDCDGPRRLPALPGLQLRLQLRRRLLLPALRRLRARLPPRPPRPTPVASPTLAPFGRERAERHHRGPGRGALVTEYTVNQIGRISTTGKITEYKIPTANSQPQFIAAGPDGALWFTEGGVDKIGRVTVTGVFSEYSLTQPGNLKGIAPRPGRRRVVRASLPTRSLCRRNRQQPRTNHYKRERDALSDSDLRCPAIRHRDRPGRRVVVHRNRNERHRSQ